MAIHTGSQIRNSVRALYVAVAGYDLVWYTFVKEPNVPSAYWIIKRNCPNHKDGLHYLGCPQGHIQPEGAEDW